MARRRRSSKRTTRTLQILFTVGWLIFFVYIISGFWGSSKPEQNAENSTGETAAPGLSVPGATVVTTPGAPGLTAPSAPGITTPAVANSEITPPAKTTFATTAGKSTTHILPISTSTTLIRSGDPPAASGNPPATTGSSSALTAPAAARSSAAPATPGLTPAQVIDRMRQAYRNANSYSDQANLTLSYSLQGKPFAERYNWKTAVGKQAGRGAMFAGDIFDVKLRSDSKLLSCYVFEIDSQNLGEQQLFLNASDSLPLNQVFADPIANYYLNGGERIPVNEATVPTRSLLLPPAASLLTHQIALPWFGNANRLKGLESQKIEGQNCHVIQSTSTHGTTILWIDQANFLLRQMRLPNQLLAPELISNEAIRDVQLVAHFDKAAFAASRDRFQAVEPRDKAWPVKKFVQIPDELPTNSLGATVNRFQLSDEKQKPVAAQSFAGRQVAWLWLDGNSNNGDLIQRFQSIKTQLARSTAAKDLPEFVVVVGPGGIQAAGGGRFHLADTLRGPINRIRSSMTHLFDADGSAATKSFELQSTPAVLITDADMKIQFAKELSESKGYNGKISIGQNWSEQFVMASQAVAEDKNVANSMLSEYGSLLNQYYGDLERASVASWFPSFVPNRRKTLASTAPDTESRATGIRPVKSSKIRLRPSLRWETNKIRRAGNIYPILDANDSFRSLLVFDGWQTVRQYDLSGQLVGTKELKLPEKEAVTAFRAVHSRQGKALNAFFSVNGPRVWFYDEQMEFKFAIPARDTDPARVLDAQVISTNGSDDQLLICFKDSGQVVVDPWTGKSKVLDRSSVRSTAVKGQKLAQVDADGSLVGRRQKDKSIIEYLHLVAAGGRGSSLFAAAGIDDRGNWLISGFDQDLRKQWDYPIGAVRFENGTEPVTSAATKSGQTVWAVADQKNRIYCLDADGGWLGDFDAGDEVRGLRLVSNRGKLLLLVTMASKIECWDLDLN